MKEEELRAVCDPCGRHGEYVDHAEARADALAHDKAAHAGALTAVLASQSGIVQG